MEPGEQRVSSVLRGVGSWTAGHKPEEGTGDKATSKATVIGVDRLRSEITLEGPGGDVVKVRITDPESLEGLKAGDQINVIVEE